MEPSIQLDEEQAIPICELDATAHPPLQHNQLMTERRVLGLKSALRLERRDGEGQKEQKSAIIAVDVRRFGHAIIRMRLSVHTGISSRAVRIERHDPGIVDPILDDTDLLLTIDIWLASDRCHTPASSAPSRRKSKGPSRASNRRRHKVTAREAKIEYLRAMTRP